MSVSEMGMSEKAVSEIGETEIEEGNKTIPKKVAAVEVMKWALRTRNSSLTGFAILTLIAFLIAAGLEIQAFFVCIGAMSCFMYYFALGYRMAKDLKEKYRI